MQTTIKTFVILTFEAKTFMKMFPENIDFGERKPLQIGKCHTEIQTLEWVSEDITTLQKKYRGFIEVSKGATTLVQITEQMNLHGWT